MTIGMRVGLRGLAALFALVATAACAGGTTPTAGSGDAPKSDPASSSEPPAPVKSGKVPAACGLVTDAEIESHAGKAPGPGKDAQSVDSRSVCLYENGMTIGVNTLDAVADMEQGAKAQNIEYIPVDGIGDRAMYSETHGIVGVVVVKGSFGVDVSLGAGKETRDKAFDLALLVLSRLA